MFKPKYQITDKLLDQIKQINKLVIELNQKRFPDIVLVELEKNAREISSFASTSIEGNPLPLTEVKKILKSKPKFIRDSEKEVLNYNNSLINLDKKLKLKNHQLTLNLILEIQKQVTQDLLPRHQSGYFRQHPVFVNNPKTRKTIFLPPDHKDVNKLMKELVDFVQQSKNTIDPIIIAGIFHKQMVIIHPFIDGNGRATRLATKLLLAELGLNTFNLFSFENYYNQNITKYFKTVGEQGNYYDLADKIDFSNWLEYFCEGIIDELLRVKKLLPSINFNPDTKLKTHHKKILEFIKNNNFITDKDYAKLTKRAKATRALDFKKLLSLNLIERKGKGKSTYYLAPSSFSW
ncbi:Fic family protein [Patescibacteria group bacterium]|nr:Fic family protein [Patescibacteria group bacterium]